MKYLVKEIINSNNAEGIEKGEKLYNFLYDILSAKTEEKIVISFMDIEKLDIKFVQNSLAKLFKNISQDYLFNHLRISDIPTELYKNIIVLVVSLAIELK